MGLFFDAGKKIAFARKFNAKGMSHLNLQVLYDCNFRCAICDFWKKPYTGYPRLTLDQVRLINDKLAPLGPLVVSIGGGEPLLHEELVPIAHELAKNHFPVMISNGWFMTDEKARELWEAGLYEVSISLDYSDPSKHDRQRKAPGAFDAAVRALDRLQRARTMPHQRVNMITVVMNDNLDDVEPLIRLSASLGVTYLVTMYSSGRGARPQVPFGNNASARLLALKKKYRHFVALRDYLARFDEASREGGVTPCYAGRNLFNIDSQGNVTLCIDTLDRPAGNILHDDLAAILAGLETLRAGNRCGACWTSCRGPVETLMYGNAGFMNMVDYYRMTRDVPVGGRY